VKKENQPFLVFPWRVRQLYLNFGGQIQRATEILQGDYFFIVLAFFLECGPVANNARPAPDEIRALAGRGGVKVLTPCFGAFGWAKGKNST
jgi:hypothetical protein